MTTHGANVGVFHPFEARKRIKKARDRSRAKCFLSTYRLRTVNVGAMLVESALQEAERLDDHHDEPGHEHEEVFDRLFESFDILS